MTAKKYFNLVVFLSTIVAPQMLRAQSAGIEQLVREVDVAKQPGEIYTLSVLAAPKLTTTIRLPEGFRAENVLCGGACIEASQLKEGSLLAGVNWIVEKKETERSIHIWPARLPSSDNPPSAFTTNLYISTDSGKAFHITLRLLNLAEKNRRADAVVNIINSAQPKEQSRVAAMQQSCRAQAREELEAETRAMMVASLDGPIICSKVSWSMPYRSGLLVARLRQLCRSNSQRPMLWVRFEIENRADAPMSIDSVSLEPQTAVFGGTSESSFYLPSTTLAAKSTLSGVAMRTFSSADVGSQGWQLEIHPEPGANGGRILIPKLSF